MPTELGDFFRPKYHIQSVVILTPYPLIKPMQKKITVVREAKQGLPFTISPEYMAAQRAYMRYHNMNPIFGISSKEARAADEAH